MSMEDNAFVIKGLPPLRPLNPSSLGKLIYDELLLNLNGNEALVDAVTQTSISYREILHQSCSLAESLTRAGYGINSITSICSENCLEFYIPVISALFIGAVIAPINHNYTDYEILHTLNISKPELIFCSARVSSRIVKVKKQLPFIKQILIIDQQSNLGEIESVNSFVSRILNGSILSTFQPTDVNPNEATAFIMCSSGTTGLPKGVMITHANIFAKFEEMSDPRVVSQDPDKCTLGLLPFFHAYGLFVGLMFIVKQVKIVVLKAFNEEVFLKTIQDYRISTLLLVPPLAIFLAKSPLVDKYDLSSVTVAACSAAPLSKAIEETLIKRLNLERLAHGYGLTECTLGVVGMLIGDHRPGSCGKVCAYLTVKVRDPQTGKSLGPNKVGEICVKGPTVMKGYYQDEEATRASFTSDGYLRTGDLGYYDNEEYFYIVDRLKELIKYKGFQVPPAELEGILLTHPDIKEAGVVGVPDEEAGELPLAFIVKDPNSNLTEDDVKKFVADKVSPQKRLRGGVVFLPAIPKNPSGKILRRELRTLLKLKL